MKTQEFHITNHEQLAEVFELFKGLIDGFGSVSLDVTAGERQRTKTQNNCIHEYCQSLADALNDAGLDMRAVMKPEAEIPWTMNSAKDHLWRSIQKAMFEKESTRDLTTVECSEVYKVLDRHIAQKFGVSVPWPTRFTKAA